MNLEKIEKIVLNNIGMRYDELSVSTDSKEILDFAMLHNCITLAREEIKLNTTIPSLLKWITATATLAKTKTYNLPSDFDIPVKMFYKGESDEFELGQVYPSNLLMKFSNISAEGTPSAYMILGQSSALIQIEFHNIPEKPGSYRGIYKPVLVELTASTDEDVLMRKYPKAVVNFGTAFAAQIIKKEDKLHDKFYQLGLIDCAKIDLRETKADSNFKELPPASIRTARKSRLSI